MPGADQHGVEVLVLVEVLLVEGHLAVRRLGLAQPAYRLQPVGAAATAGKRERNADDPCCEDATLHHGGKLEVASHERGVTLAGDHAGSHE